MKRWLRTLSNKTKTAAMVMVLLTAQAAGAALPFMPSAVVHATPKCVVDTAGANDVPNQKDLTQMCTDTANLPASEQVTWNWDDLGTSGGNTMDACALFDTNSNGFADYSACVTTTGNNPAQFAGLAIYKCSDNSVDKCFDNGGSALPGPYASSCTVDQENTDPFNGTGKNKGDFYPQDTVANCAMHLADVGGQTASLLDVCSYPSGQPNSNPSDCVVAIPGEAKLTVVKSLVPASDSGRFDLKIDGTTDATNVGDGGTTGVQVVTAANNNHTHTIAEAANSTTNATSLSNYTTSVVCKDQHGTGAPLASGTPTDGTLRSLSVTVAPDSDVVCTFTNTRAAGTITVTKQVNNNHGGGATADQFPLFVSGTQVTSGTTNSYIANQSYTVSENGGPDGYTQTSATCVNTATQASVGTTFTLTASENVSCTIVNSDTAPMLTLKKVVVNDNGGTATADQWTLKAQHSSDAPLISQTGTPSSNGTVATTASVAATAGVAYDLSESGPSGYSASSWSCTGGTLSGSQVTLALAQNVTCTITNNDIAPQLTVIKRVVNNYGGGASASNFTMNVTGQNVSSSSFPGSEAGTTVTLKAGAYSVGESGGPAGYTGSYSSDCSGTIAVGDTKTCTITNSDNPATISGHKYEVNANGAQGSGGTPIQNWTIYLLLNGQAIAHTTTDASGTYSFTGLSWSSNYSLAECQNASDGCTGWTQIYHPGGVTVNGTSLTSTNNDFGNFENGSISGFKFHDVNGNGTWDGPPAGEFGLPGWTINLTKDTNGDGTPDTLVATQPTDSEGAYLFDNLAPATYGVCEVMQTGWVQTFPVVNGGCYTLAITQSGQSYKYENFGNQGRGTITVIKRLNPATDPGKFNLQINGQTYATNVGDGGTTGAVAVAEGTYSVDELAGTNTSLADYDSGVSCDWGDKGGRIFGTSMDDIQIAPGDNVVCTITNTRHTGDLTVNKVVSPSNDSGKFNLLINGAAYATNVGDGGTTGAVTLPTNTYTVSETAGTATSLADYSSTYSCTTGQHGSGTSVDVSVTTDASVSCTFTNVRYAHIVVKKQTLPASSTQAFAFDASYNLLGFSLSNGQSNTSGDLLPGTYTVNESTTTGWDLTNLSCDSDNAGVEGSMATINLGAGQTITCTYTNTQRGTVHGTKTIVNSDGSSADSQSGVAGVTINLYDDTNTLVDSTVTDNNGTYSFTNLVPGDYSVEEVAPTGYTQMGGGGSFTIVPGADETANGTVDFTNFKNGSISGYKFNDLNGDGIRNENESKLSDWTINLLQDGVVIDHAATDANGDYSFTNLVPGDYEVCEVAQGGWVQTSTPKCYDITIDMSGEADTAVFGNQGRVSLTIVKNVDDGFGNITTSTDWTWTASNANYKDSGITHTAGTTLSNIPAGEYSVSENQKPDYHFTSVSCDNDAEVAQSETFSITLNPGDEVTCTFTNTRDTGFVTVTKHIDPREDTGKFNLLVDGVSNATDVSDGGTTGSVRVVTGTHNVSELAGTSTSLKDYDSSYVCWTGEEEVLASGDATMSDDFTVTTGQDVYCDFYNTRHATLTVIKHAFPANSSQSFNFTLNKVTPVLEDDEDSNALNLTGGTTTLVKNFQLDDNTDPALPNNDVSSLSPGIYEVSEASTTGWDLVGMDCGDVTTVKTATGIRFELLPGQQLTCAFTNQKHVVPQVLSDTTAVLTNTGLPIVAYVMASLTIVGAALFVTRRQSN